MKYINKNMVIGTEKVANHPDKEYIIKLLTNGYGVRKIAKILREKYPDDSKMHISECTLQSFRKNKLNIHGQALEKIKEVEFKKEEVVRTVKADKKIASSSVYKKKIKEAVNLHIDIRQEISELFILIKSRTEELFNKAAAGRVTINEEANLQKYFQTWMQAIERHAKYIDKISDKTVETNVNITIIEDQIHVIRSAVIETLNELDPELRVKFLDKLNMKMTDLSYKRKSIDFEKIYAENKTQLASVKLIEEVIEESDEDIIQQEEENGE